MRCAFTLAEVLITLGVIGIVAAMTIPSLIQMHKKHEIEAKIRENYSRLAQTFKAILSEHDIDDLTGSNELYIPVWNHYWVYTDNLITEMQKHLKIVHVYPNKDIRASQPIKMCLGDKTPPRKYKDGAIYIDLCGNPIKSHFNPVGNPPNYTYHAIELIDGTCMQINAGGYAENWNDITKDGGMEIYVDINGTGKAPNVVGIDTFVYTVTLDGNVHFYGWQAPNGSGNGGIDRYYTSGVCATRGAYGCGQLCGEKIKRNGWRVWSRYPWHYKVNQ